MANKSVTITEPVADDVCAINIKCDGAGNVTLLNGSVQAASDDSSTVHARGFEFDPDNLPAAVTTALNSLITECLTQFKSQHGF